MSTEAVSGARPVRPVMIALRASGVLLLLDVSAERLPAVVHWGPVIPDLDEAEATALVVGSTPVTGPNDVDVPARLAVLPELWTGWTGRPGLQGSRGGNSWTPRFVVRSVLLDGIEVRGFAQTGAGVVDVKARDDEAQLDLTIRIELLPSGLVRARASVANLAEEPYTVDGVTLALPVPAEAAEILDFAGRWSRERVPQRIPFPFGTHLRENRKGRTGADSAYVLHAGPPGFGFAHGQIFAVHTAFSGNHVHYAEQVFTGHRVLGGGELLMSGEVRLAQGEKYDSPWLYGSTGTGLDEVAARFHTHLRSRQRAVGSDRPVTLNVWEAVYFDHHPAQLIDLAERAAAVGVERFVLDDGWFGARRNEHAGLGDWVVSPEPWPDGLHPLVDRVRELGMQFGLWFEPEMVNLDSDVARAHPDWVMSARRELPVPSRDQQVFNLGIPAAYDHVKTQILALLDEYDIGYIKWDHNRDLIESGNQLDHGRPGVHAQTLALYRLIDEIRAAHPDLEIESCSSGGARIDLGVLERTDRVWVSDCIDPLERQHLMRWTGQLIPPEYLGSHIASGRSHTTGRVHDLAFRAGTAIFGHLGIEWDLKTASEEELSELRSWIAFYTSNRELLLTGDVRRMDTHDPNLFLHGVVAADGSQAIFAMALVGSAESCPGPNIKFRGLDPGRPYLFRPILVHTNRFSGLQVPPWWGRPEGSSSSETPPGPDAGEALEQYPGCVISGAALEFVGLSPPRMDPDQVVLFHATAVGERRP